MATHPCTDKNMGALVHVHSPSPPQACCGAALPLAQSLPLLALRPWLCTVALLCLRDQLLPCCGLSVETDPWPPIQLPESPGTSVHPLPPKTEVCRSSLPGVPALPGWRKWAPVTVTHSGSIWIWFDNKAPSVCSQAPYITGGCGQRRRGGGGGDGNQETPGWDGWKGHRDQDEGQRGGESGSRRGKCWS